VFQDDNDKAAKKAREAEAQKKRQQNAVPSWHAWSTVSGEMTTLGAEAAKRQEMPIDGTDADGDGEVLENDFGDECKCSDSESQQAMLASHLGNPWIDLLAQLTVRSIVDRCRGILRKDEGRGRVVRCRGH
jgi:hypothetical protein